MNETLEKIKEVISYDGESGVFTWVVDRLPKCKKGDAVGTRTDSGYLFMTVNGVKYLAHRLAWFVSTGSLPTGVIDHIDGDRLNNRIDNLRDVSVGTNNLNKKMDSRNSSGCTGVRWNKAREKWVSRITINKKEISLGYFFSKEEAISARKNAELTLKPNEVPHATNNRIKKELTPDIIRQLLEYDPTTGVFTWRVDRGGSNIVGKKAGFSKNGYFYISILGKAYLIHRLAWAYVHNSFPENGKVIDHINRDRLDNRISNLCMVSKSENIKNSSLSKNNKTGVKGVSYNTVRKQWVASIGYQGTQIFLGWFKQIQLAEKAYVEASLRMFPNIQGGI